MARATIAIHGGAGAIARSSMDSEKEQHYRQALSEIVASGQALLAAGASALDVVTEAVRQLEECPLFNAGRGSVFTHQGTHELDACVMDGRTRQAGAVAGVSRVRNPVLAARAVLETSPHLLFIGAGAESFGRVGDSPLVGAGCYASGGVAVSCTGTGEVFMRTLAAYDIAALMEYGGLSLEEASRKVVMEKIPALGGSGGLIAVDAEGNVVLPFNSEGMYRGYGTVGEAPVVAIYREEP